MVFQCDDVKVPAAWSQVATDVLAQKYFRKAGVPTLTRRVEEADVPAWLQRSEQDPDGMKALPTSERYGMETDARSVFGRLAGCWTYWGHKHGYFDTEEDAHAFHDLSLIHI